MKYQYKTQDFLTSAVTAVVDLFRVQEERRGAFINQTEGNYNERNY